MVIGGASVAKKYKLLGRVDDEYRENKTSTVWVAENVKTSDAIIIKRIDLESRSIKDIEKLREEIAIIRSFNHNNIIRYYDVFSVGSESWILMPYFSFGSAVNLFRKEILPARKEFLLAYVLRAVFNALAYLHKLGYAHRNVRGEHILVSGNGSICLSGFHKTIKNTLFNKQWTAYELIERAAECVAWVAPELLAQDICGYNCKVDIYSVGITAIELAYGKTPFEDMSATQVLLEKLNGVSHTRIYHFVQDAADTIYSTGFYELIDSCLKLDQEQRLTAVESVAHPFIKQFRPYNENVLQEFLQLVKPFQGNKQYREADTEAHAKQEGTSGTEIEWQF